VPDTEFSPDEFLPASKRDRQEMMAELEKLISDMANVHLKKLLGAIVNDPDIRRRLLIAPAAKTMHHPYIGGLVEHVLSMCGLVVKVAEHYNGKVNKDLLLAGAILHDIGKIYELTYQRSFDYTDEGKLLGHITLGVELIDSKLRLDKDFPRETAVLLKHMVLSHHGYLEFGSPKKPKTLEAMILYYIDDLDAKVAAITALTAVNNVEAGSNWTPYQKLLERAIYKGNAGQAGAITQDAEKDKEDDDIDLELFRKPH
jgi:3'-5' exoribonuclease